MRIAQCARVKKRGQSGWGSYLFIGLLLLIISAGLVYISYIFPFDLQMELIGSAALLYGVFLIFSAQFRLVFDTTPMVDAGAAEDSEPAEELAEEAGDR